MSHVIVGSLLALIIIIAGYMITFYNMMINKKTIAEAYWERIKVLEDEIKREEYLFSYNQAVQEYNRYISRFPHALASLALGIQQLPDLSAKSYNEL